MIIIIGSAVEVSLKTFKYTDYTFVTYLVRYELFFQSTKNKIARKLQR